MAKFIEGLPWLEKDKELLREVYPSNTKEFIMSVFPDRTWKAINGAANRYKIRKIEASKSWSNEDIDLLVGNYENIETTELIKLFPNRSLNSINHKSSRLGLRKYEKHKDTRTIWSQENAKNIVESQGYVFLNTYIENHHRYLKVKCKIGHVTNIPSYNFENGQRCIVCSGKYKREFEEIEDMIIKNNYKMLTNRDEYLNMVMKIQVECPIGHKYGVTSSEFKSGKRCQKCWLENMGKFNLLSLEYVCEQYSLRGFILEENQKYYGIHDKLNCLCVKHLSSDKLSLSFYQVVHADINCSHCALDERKEKYKTSYLNLIDSLSLNGISLITNENDYINMRVKIENKKIEYICEIHKEKGIQCVNSITMMRNREDDEGICKYCVKDSIRGKNHYKWRGGVSNISQYLRGKIYKWKEDSLENSNYECEVTGLKQNLVVHHIHSFSSIVKETLETLNLPILTVGQYSDEHLLLIENKCIDLHYKNGLGAIIQTDVHDLFHTLYSNFDFTVEDYYEFKERYIAGEFKGVS